MVRTFSFDDAQPTRLVTAGLLGRLVGASGAELARSLRLGRWGREDCALKRCELSTLAAVVSLPKFDANQCGPREKRRMPSRQRRDGKNWVDCYPRQMR